jgi:alanyl aminopeptidase
MRRALSRSILAALPCLLLPATAPLAGCGGEAQIASKGGPATTPTAPGSTAATTAPATAAPPPPREDGRLPALAAPARYAVSLTVDPTQPRFQGTATILVDVLQPTATLVLHGRDLHVASVTLQAGTGGAPLTGASSVRMAHGGLHADELVLTFPSVVPAGRATLTVAYDAPFGTELSGLYRVKEGDRWYAFTQFEATDARRAFPCFDEPSFKVPFDLSIETPKGMIAVTNAPEKAHADTPAGTRFDFVTTPPLPSYLVAFAVGDFDVRVGGTSPIPMRLISAKGKGALGGTALEVTEGIVKKLGDYFGISYPYAKLDVVAVPDFAAGAMENPGLITFREELLLQDPARSPVSAQRNQALVIAHELAHIWFGDLVTMQWWNDVWLNEGFATWMEAKVVDQWRPTMGARLEEVSNAQEVMNTDALSSARAVRQPVASTSEIGEAFDGITYQKGSAVIGMVEHWLGEETFQRGVREYMKAHAWKNAKADDLLAALDHASKKDVTGMAATFLDRSGVPNVAVTSSCAGSALKFELRQSAWHPLGVTPKDTTAAPWTIPVCVQTGAQATGGGKSSSACTELAGEHGALQMLTARCPAWSYPNAEEAGYYRFSLPEKDIRAIAGAHEQLDLANRVGFVANLWAQVRAGTVGSDVLLDALPAFDADTERHVVEQVARVLEEVNQSLIDDAARPAFRAYVAARMTARKRALGWAPKPNERETSDRALSRERVLLAMGELARDPATLKEAEERALSWLKDPASVDANVAGIALRIASVKGGEARFEALRTAARQAKTPQDRITALRAMGSFTEPGAQRRVFDLVLTDEVKMQDIRYVLGTGAMSRPGSSEALYEWMKGHWDAVRAKFPGGQTRRFLPIVGTACTKAEHEDMSAFFAPRVTEIEAAKRPFAVESERSSACVALREHAAPAIAARFGAGAQGGGARRLGH